MLQCPRCDSVIGEDDFNVSTDLAVCRNCHAELKYSELRATVDGSTSGDLPCPRHVLIEDLGNHIEITYRRIYPGVWFLIPFTCLWSGLSVGLGLIVPLIQGKLELAKSAFMLPFVIGTVVLLGVIYFLLFSRTRIILNGADSWFIRGPGFLSYRRQFDFNDVGSVIIRKSTMSVNNVQLPEICLLMKTSGELPFGAMMTDESRSYIASVIASHVENR